MFIFIRSFKGVLGLRCLLLHYLSFLGKFLDFQFTHSVDRFGQESLVIVSVIMHILSWG